MSDTVRMRAVDVYSQELRKRHRRQEFPSFAQARFAVAQSQKF